MDVALQHLPSRELSGELFDTILYLNKKKSRVRLEHLGAWRVQQVQQIGSLHGGFLSCFGCFGMAI